MIVHTLLIIAACGQPAPDVPRPEVARPNIVVVSLDTVRWDHTSLSGYRHDTTPHLAALAAMPGATTFTMAFSDAAWSLPAYASIFTGRTVLSHGLGFLTMTLPAEQATLAEVLTAYGYHTHAWCSGPHLAPIMDLSRGFSAYEHTLRSAPLALATSEGLQWLREERQKDTPFFLFLQGYDAHYPYRSPTLIGERFADTPHVGTNHCPGRVPERACGRIPARGNKGKNLTTAERAHIVSHYDSAILYADYQLGLITAALSEQGLLESTVLIALSDHGEGLGEDGRFTHDVLIGDRVSHVPLVIRLPTDTPPRRWDGVVSLSGLVPTLMANLGLVPPSGADGAAFTMALTPGGAPTGEEVSRSASMCCYAVRTAEWSLEGERGPDGIDWALYAEGQGDDVAADHPETVAVLRATIADWPLDLGDLNVLNQEPAKELSGLKEALQEGGYWKP